MNVPTDLDPGDMNGWAGSPMTICSHITMIMLFVFYKIRLI
jgi:hypothetical protein